MTEPQNCQARAHGLDVQCLKDDKTHIFAETAEERLHEGLRKDQALWWGKTEDIEEVFGPVPAMTECD